MSCAKNLYQVVKMHERNVVSYANFIQEDGNIVAADEQTKSLADYNNILGAVIQLVKNNNKFIPSMISKEEMARLIGVRVSFNSNILVPRFQLLGSGDDKYYATYSLYY